MYAVRGGQNLASRMRGRRRQVRGFVGSSNPDRDPRCSPTVTSWKSATYFVGFATGVVGRRVRHTGRCQAARVGRRQVQGWSVVGDCRRGWLGVVALAATSEPPFYRGYRYRVEIISHAVRLYFRFHLSLRDVDELLAERGVSITYETTRAWCSKFGPSCDGDAHA